MAQQVQVVEDGLERPSTRRRASIPGWALLGLGFLVGLVLGSAVLTSEDAQPSPANEEIQADPVDDELAFPPEARGIGDVIDGFHSVLVAVASNETDVSDLITWPPETPMTTNRMLGGSDLAVDSSGQYFAMTSPLPDAPGATLSTGRYHSLVPQVSGVTSFAWHDSIAGTLAFTIVENAEWQLWKLLPNGREELVTAGNDRASSLIGWGDWGFVIQGPSTQITLLTAGGEFKATQAGTAFSSSADGWIVAADESLMLLSAGGGVQRLRVDDALTGVRDAVLSPSRELVAVVDATGIHVVSREEASIVAEYKGPTGGSLAWTDDSRFVAATKQRGLVILDLIEEEQHHILDNRSFVFVDVR
jgi:hypothetical protein